MELRTAPMTEMTGLEVHGLTSESFLERAAADQCAAWLDRYGVVVYRDACLGDAELVAFSRMIGEVVVTPNGGLPDHPEVSAISLDPGVDALAEYRRGTFYWHIDGATDLEPQKATFLSAHEVADEGGDTEFANTYASYDALADEDKAMVDGLRVVHSLAAAQSLVYPNPTPQQRKFWEAVPSREHPLVWTRPNGRKSLLIGATAGEVVGLPPEEGRALLDRLLDWSTQPAFVLRHQWRRGDLVVWDNTGILQRALPYEPTSRRLLHRTTLVGDHAVA